MDAPIPKNEPERLKALKSLHILDTPTEERFDRITQLAQYIFKVPISTLSLVDSNREWFKSCMGVEASEGPRAISFCGHAMLEDDLFLIPDTTKDPRFADNPMVTGKPYLRFYAGQSLSNAAGFKIGTFCIKDTKPRTLTEEEKKILKDLASWAELEINMHDLGLALNERRLAEVRFHAILEAAPEAMIIVDQKGEIAIVNSQAEKLFGYGRDELLGKSIEIFLPQDLRAKHVAHRGVFAKEARIRPMGSGLDLFGITKDGRKVPLEISLGPLKIGSEVYVISTIRDITERKMREYELREAHREVAEREKALRHTFNQLNNAHDDLKQTQNQLVQSEKLASIGQLAAGVAHEINNPVGFINNNMEILEQYVADYMKILKIADQLKESVLQGNSSQAKVLAEEIAKAEKESNLDYILGDTNNLLQHSRKGIERIQKIVMDLRTFAREDKNEMEHVKIEEVIESILSIVQNEIKYKAKLNKNYGDTPIIECSPQRLGQVFINLLINAVQAMEGTGTITIKTYKQNEFVCIDVSDTGKGIPPENLTKIFDPFFTTKPIGQGTGLGLSVSYEIIKKHNGSLTVQSKVGEGTTFNIMLPINQK